MPLVTYVGMAAAGVAITGLLCHARSEVPAVSSGQADGGILSAVPWVMAFHPIVLFLGFCSYMGALEASGSGLAGVAAWGLLWPVAAEVASGGHPYRVARLLRLYLEYRLAVPFTADHKIYRRKARLLRPTEWKLLGLVLPVLLCGLALTGLLSGVPFE